MQSETKIKEAIYKVLRREIENEDGFSFGTDLSEVATEIAAAIAPHLEAGAGWEDAPEWALWRTVDRDGTITYWDMEPYKSYGEENWKHQNARVNFKEIRHFHTGWENSLEQRPR